LRKGPCAETLQRPRARSPAASRTSCSCARRAASSSATTSLWSSSFWCFAAASRASPPACFGSRLQPTIAAAAN